MNKEQLEFYLNKGIMFGYNTINNESNIGWVLISKQFPTNNFFERFTEYDNPELYKDQLKIKLEPYRVRIAELKREIFDSDRSISNEDYTLNENYSFKTLNEVDIFLRKLDLDLSLIKWSSEIEFS